jgi:hypothetical protein
MSEFWYYAESSETKGPISFAELIGILSRLPNPSNVPVWRVGFDDWKAAGTDREIAERLFRPPPLRAQTQPNPEPPRPQSSALGPKLKGLQGWLAFLGWSQFIGIVSLLFYYLTYYTRAIEGGWFKKLPLAFWSEAAINVATFALVIQTTILFRNESKQFPRFYVCQSVIAMFMTPLTVIFAGLISSSMTGRPFSDVVMFNDESISKMIGTGLGPAIWMIYVLRSKRVANTFIK